MHCILCDGDTRVLLTKKDDRRYFFCTGECGLIFLDPEDRLSPQDEKERYELHNNDPQDEGYRDFLRRLTDPLIERLQPGAQGLDFGCGPGPTLSHIMEEAGFTCENYDPFFADDRTLLDHQYDFVTATEVFEHLYDPRATMEQLVRMLAPGGVLAIMTEMVISPERFEQWWYHTDPTHVSFFSPKTFEWLAKQHECVVDFSQKNIAFFTRR